MDSLDNSQNQAQTAKQNNQGQSNLVADTDNGVNVIDNASAGDTSSLSSGDTSTEDILNKDILELMGAKNMPEEKKQELYQKMMETIKNRAMQRAVSSISEADKALFNQIVEQGEKAPIENFLRERNIDIKKLMVQEAVYYKIEMKEMVDSASKKLNQ